jgi:hypothetical protein
MNLATIFFHPLVLPTHSLLWLMLPLVVSVAVVYKTLRTNNLRRLPLQILLLAIYISGGAVVLAVGLWAIQAYCL